MPTGNFGDIFAGFVAKRMGIPVDRLVIATNVNDILDRTLKTGRYETRGVKASTSPSMDIQVSSNFERLLFEVHGRDPNAVRRMMASLAQSGAFAIGDRELDQIRHEFGSGATDEAETAATIRPRWRRRASCSIPIRRWAMPWRARRRPPPAPW